MKDHSLHTWASERPEVELMKFDTIVKSVAEARRISGREDEKFIKTIILTNEDLYVAVILCSEKRVDTKKLPSTRKWRLTSPNETLKVTGYEVGGVPPMKLGKKLDVIYIDPDVLKYDRVIAGGGTTKSLLSLPTNHILVGDIIIRDLTKAS